MKFLFAALFGFVAATNVNFNNRCNHQVTVVKNDSVKEEAICALSPGQSCSRSYSAHGMNFKNGFDGKTLAEFTFNTYLLDVYDVSLLAGFDQSMQITSSTGGPTITCKTAGCPDAFLDDTNYTKVESTKTGGTFNINFCP